MQVDALPVAAGVRITELVQCGVAAVDVRAAAIDIAPVNAVDVESVGVVGCDGEGAGAGAASGGQCVATARALLAVEALAAAAIVIRLGLARWTA